MKARAASCKDGSPTRWLAASLPEVRPAETSAVDQYFRRNFNISGASATKPTAQSTETKP